MNIAYSLGLWKYGCFYVLNELIPNNSARNVGFTEHYFISCSYYIYYRIVRSYQRKNIDYIK